MRIYKKFKGVFVNFGWFPGNEFVLFRFAVGQAIEGLDRIDMIVLLDIQVAKAAFTIGVER